MPFVVAGRPSLDRLGDVLESLERAGASVVEVGVPFSDPIADGPVIAAAMNRALEAGVTPGAVFEAVSRVRGRTGMALVAMSSVSIVHRMGPERFVREAVSAGFDGFIFPDAPLEEAEAFAGPARAAGAAASLLIAPTTPPARARAIAEASSGFVYVLAAAGITGERDAPPEVRERVAMVRGSTALPVAVGFGVSRAEHVRAVVAPVERGGAGADAAIVGSALVRRMEEAIEGGKSASDAAHKFVFGLAGGLSW